MQLFGLCLYIAFAAKSEQLKAIGRASVVPALFNINEPLIFGLPIIYNPALAIPFILAPMVTATIYYFVNALHLMLVTKPESGMQPKITASENRAVNKDFLFENSLCVNIPISSPFRI